jgi:hypothetical protein
VTSAGITDATTVGKAVLTAADALTARTALGAGTSSFALPTQSGQSGKFLTTDGSNPSWGTPAGGGGSGVPVAPAAVKTPLRVMAALDDGTIKDYRSSTAAAANATSPLTTPTYDGSGQIAELDVLYFPEGWNGYQYWMANGPYPNAQTPYENPCLLVSQDGQTWQVPPGVTNPLYPMPAGGHNADPSIFCDVDGTMWVYWVSVNNSVYTIKYAKSTDGANWSAAADLCTINDGDSPAIIWTGTEYRLYLHYTPASSVLGLYYSSASTVTGLGTPTTPAGFTNTSPASRAWSHFDLQVYAGRYYILFSDTISLYLGTSLDGVTWTVNSQASLTAGASGSWDDGGIYRTSFAIAQTANGPAFDLWYVSHNIAANTYRVGYTRLALGSSGAATGVPSGGTTGQVLTKNSNASYDTTWTTPTAGGGAAGSMMFGSGYDGDAVISSNTNLSTDMAYRNLTINSGVSLKANGCRLYVSGTLTLNGTIHANGPSASGASGSSGQVPSLTIGGGADSPGGGTGPGTAGGSFGSDALGGAGGAGGASGATAGGAGGTVSLPGPARGGARAFAIPHQAVKGQADQASASPAVQSGGASGGSGAGDGTHAGGGGGAGAGMVLVVARHLAGTGTISAAGGNGGNGTGGNAGGGGGGGGGVIVVMTSDSSNPLAVTVAGGNGGNGAGTGAAGSPGSAGRTYIHLGA